MRTCKTRISTVEHLLSFLANKISDWMCLYSHVYFSLIFEGDPAVVARRIHRTSEIVESR